MEDIAHNASGPASPKPGDIAPQQASRSDSPAISHDGGPQPPKKRDRKKSPAAKRGLK